MNKKGIIMHYLIEFWFELSRESHRPAKWVASKILASVKGCENVLRWGGGGGHLLGGLAAAAAAGGG